MCKHNVSLKLKYTETEEAGRQDESLYPESPGERTHVVDRPAEFHNGFTACEYLSVSWKWFNSRLKLYFTLVCLTSKNQDSIMRSCRSMLEKDHISNSENIKTLVFFFTLSSQRSAKVLLTFPLHPQERFLDMSFSAIVWLVWMHVLEEWG